MTKSLTEFKKMVERFYSGKRKEYKSGLWSIIEGGYDCWFQISYSDTPIIECIDGNLYVITDVSFVEKDGYSINAVLLALVNMGKNLHCPYIDDAKDNKLIAFRCLVRQIHQKFNREFSDGNWLIRVLGQYNLSIYYDDKLVIRVNKNEGIKFIKSEKMLESEGYTIKGLSEIIQKEYIDPIELTEALF